MNKYVSGIFKSRYEFGQPKAQHSRGNRKDTRADWRQSALYETKPWGYSSPNDYINACVLVLTTMAPRQVLEATQRIEREMGRTMKSVDGEYQDRIIDIDILMIDDLVIDEPDFKVPHPLMEERDFVMKPLKEILK